MKKRRPNLDKIVRPIVTSTEYLVKYDLFNRELPKKKSTYSHVCFAQLPNHYVGFKKQIGVLPDTMTLIIRCNEKTNKEILTSKQKRDWVEMCKKNGVLPRDANVKISATGKTAKMTFDIKDHTLSLLYIQLVNFRSIRDDPVFVEEMLYLVNKIGMDFFLALAVASKLCLNHSGHSVLPEVSSYYNNQNNVKPSADNFRINVGQCVGLIRVINKPDEYDKRKLFARKITGYTSFNCQGTIRSACQNKYLIKTSKFFDEDLIKAIRSCDETTLAKLI